MQGYDQVVAFTQPLQEMLRQAALDPSPVKLLLVIVILAVMPFSIVVPMTVTCLLAGALLPFPIVGPPVILAGLLLNTVLAWSLARTVFGRRIEAWIEKRGGALATLRAHAKEGGFKWSFISRFLPAPFIAPPMILASAGVPLSQVLAGTALAMLPWSFVYAWAGKAGREGSLKSMAMAALAIVIIMLGAMALRRNFLPSENLKRGTAGNPQSKSNVSVRKPRKKVKR